ncbi:MAG: VOC family protein [Acidobacteriota bacterium]
MAELVLRVHDLDLMHRFYEDVLNLEVLRRFPNSVFFRIAEGHAGHPQVLALFERAETSSEPSLDRAPAPSVSQEHSPLHHLAFDIDLADYEREQQRLEGLGLVVEARVFEWVGWRSLFFEDPEANSVELVCFDPTIKKA